MTLTEAQAIKHGMAKYEYTIYSFSEGVKVVVRVRNPSEDFRYSVKVYKNGDLVNSCNKRVGSKTAIIRHLKTIFK